MAAALVSAIASRSVPGVLANGACRDADGDAAIGAVAQAVAIIDTGDGGDRHGGYRRIRRNASGADRVPRSLILPPVSG